MDKSLYNNLTVNIAYIFPAELEFELYYLITFLFHKLVKKNSDNNSDHEIISL